MLAGPPTILVRPQSQQVKAGGIASFYCTAEGAPPPQIHWRKNGKRVSRKFSRFVNFSPPRNAPSKLHIHSTGIEIVSIFPLSFRESSIPISLPRLRSRFHPRRLESRSNVFSSRLNFTLARPGSGRRLSPADAPRYTVPAIYPRLANTDRDCQILERRRCSPLLSSGKHPPDWSTDCPVHGPRYLHIPRGPVSSLALDRETKLEARRRAHHSG